MCSDDIMAQVHKRDGLKCQLTGLPFTGHTGVDPILTHVFPYAVHGKVGVGLSELCAI
jgi:hypothetical protein